MGAYYPDSLNSGKYYPVSSSVQPKRLMPFLPYKHNSIIFEYSTTYYEKWETNQFQYILEGFDKDWSEWNKKTEKEYTNLPERNYKFKVRAKNIYGTISQASSFEFTILPPWYRTLWAYLTYIILLLLIVRIILLLYTKRLKAANIRLEQIVKTRTTKINSQKEEIQAQANELEKLSIVASETDNAVIIMDAEGNFEWVNEGFNKTYQTSFEKFVDEKSINIVRNIINLSTNPNIKQAIEKCKETKQSEIYESFYKTSARETIWFQTTLTPIIDNDGAVNKLVAIDTDITELKKAEEEIDGDFYWISKNNNMIIIAAADCTGHGVPGALMSMLGITFLNEIVKSIGITNPAEILNVLREKVIQTLNQKEDDESSRDGMDVAICTIDPVKKTLLYAGANSSALIIKNELYNWKGDQEQVDDVLVMGIKIDFKPETEKNIHRNKYSNA